MSNEKVITYRQGDILFKKIDEIPTEATLVKDGVVARGEVTGHTHALRPSASANVIAVGTVMYINAIAKAYIDHQEHDTITLPTGSYVCERQREYTPDGWRQVAD